jgi:hypothetical protein
MILIEIGTTMTWRRISDDNRRVDEIPVKILKIAKNGVIVEAQLDGGTRKVRVARDRLLPVLRPPAPFVRPTTPPADPKPMLGEPAGRIPTCLPKPWDPMIMVSDTECTVHAVPTGTRALCGYESGTGWQWAPRFDVTCQHCWRKIAEEELEKDSIVKSLRRYGHTGPITREDYISFNWAGCSIRPWTAEHEAELPLLLQDWERFERNARRRKQYSERKYGQWAREEVERLVREMREKERGQE